MFIDSYNPKKRKMLTVLLYINSREICEHYCSKPYYTHVFFKFSHASIDFVFKLQNAISVKLI